MKGKPFRSSLLLSFAALMSGVSIAGIAIAALAEEPCCAVVAVDSAKGIATIQNRFTGRIAQIRDAALVRTLAVGDQLDADAGMRQLVSVKGIAKTAALIAPDYGEPCCGVVAVVQDLQAAQALMGALYSEPLSGASSAGHAGLMRSKVRGADPVTGIQ